MENEKDISQLIKKYRTERGMSQPDLSAASGIGLSTIKAYEAGIRNPKIKQLKILANALGVSVNDFIDIQIENTSDVMSLVTSLYKQTKLDIIADKDKDGNVIPSSISFKFKDDNINRTLAYFVMMNEMNQIDSPLVLTLHKDGVDMPIEIEKKKK